MDVVRSPDFMCVVTGLLIFGVFTLFFLGLRLWERAAREEERQLENKKEGKQ